MAQLTHSTDGSTLADILERVLDKGVVIAGDIKIQIADIDLLTIKIRLIIASVDKAKEIGIRWWEQDPDLSLSKKVKELEQANKEMSSELHALRSRS